MPVSVSTQPNAASLFCRRFCMFAGSGLLEDFNCAKNAMVGVTQRNGLQLHRNGTAHFAPDRGTTGGGFPFAKCYE